MKTTTIDDLRGLLDGLERQTREGMAAEARLKSFEATLHEISAVLADMLELMQKKAGDPATGTGPAQTLDLGPLVEAIKAMPPPSVSVAAPVSPANKDWRELRVSINRGQYGSGPMESFNIVKVK